MRIVGKVRTSEIDAIPEPFLPNQLDVGLTFFIEFLGGFHLFRLLVTRTQQVGNSDGTLDVPDEYPLVISNKPVYLVLSVCVVDTRECNHKLREYGDSMG
jgi:hypothetical protein